MTTAVHAGHDVRKALLSSMSLSEEKRLREEDPLTDIWASVGDHIFINRISRFEVDLNREKDKAIYLRPQDAWGLKVWSDKPSKEEVEKSLEIHNEFYSFMKEQLEKLIDKHGKVLLLDIHSYCHRRAGVAKAAPAEDNPDIDLGLTTADQNIFKDVIDAFEEELAAHPCKGKKLFVGRNVRYPDGGNFPEWVYEQYGKNVCAITLEYKKIYMDEWSGTADLAAVEDLRYGLEKAVERVKGMLVGH